MIFLGEFLSPQNSISQDQDQLTKYFYFRPDMYDDPDSDLENIFKVREMPEFPKRGDLLAENNNYAVDSIEVSKRISDEEKGVKKVSYVVTATYDSLANIRKREEASGEQQQTGSTTIYIDEDGNKILGEIFPWKLRAQWNFQPIELTVPFLKAYTYSQGATSWNTKTLDVLTSAKCRFNAETKRYQLEITYTKNYETAQEWDLILQPYVNSDNVNLTFDYRGTFPAGTLLMLPPTCTRQWGEFTKYDDDGEPVVDGQGNQIKEIKQYFTYTVRMIYDPEGHDKILLDIGTYALFGDDTKPSQIWEVTVVNSDGVIENGGQARYTSAAEALRIQAAEGRAGKSVNATPISEPLPLTSTGQIDLAAITDPDNNPYRTKTFTQYAGRRFTDLPFKN